MKLVIVIIRVQLALGCVAMLLSLLNLHGTSLARARWAGFEAELKAVSRSSEVTEPVIVRGYTYADLIEAHQGSVRSRSDLAYAFLLFSGLMVGIGWLLLSRTHALSRTLPSDRGCRTNQPEATVDRSRR
jgi:hypothetical protein